MKKQTLFLCLAFFMTVLIPKPLEAKYLDWGGYLLGDLRSRSDDDKDPFISRQELRLDLQVEAKPTENMRLFSEGWLRAWGFPDITSLDDLSSYEKLLPVTGELREAYADLYEFILPKLDFRLGRQRIAWGSAEKISVIDNLNPDDLEDRWDFGRHLSSDALKLTYYGDPLTVTAVYIPIFRPARLPEDVSSLISEIPLTSIRNIWILRPGNHLRKNATLGSRLSARVAGWDLSVSYIFGRDDLPTAVNTVIYPTAPPNIDLALEYLRQHIAGLDLAGELLGLGVWGELALFFPEKAKRVTDLRALGLGISEERTEVYLKGVAGLDYTFRNGLYANLQYSHGLFHENSRDSLHDYLFFGLEWKILGDRVKIGPLGVALEVADFKDLADSWALVLNPEISFYPFDNVEFNVGLRWIEGRDGTTFGGEKRNDEIYFRGKFNF